MAVAPGKLDAFKAMLEGAKAKQAAAAAPADDAAGSTCPTCGQRCAAGSPAAQLAEGSAEPEHAA